MTWTLKMNEATARRCDKLSDQGIKIDSTTHEGRTLIGYNYFDYISEPQVIYYEDDEE